MIELKKCPFCGGEPVKESCDRIISIGCKKCRYYRSFWGVITPIKHDVIVSKHDGKVEYYNPNAHEEADEAWNRRAYESGTS